MKMLCPHCGVKGTADDSYIGKMVKCPKCEGAFEVFSKEQISTPEEEQTLATLTPVDSEVRDIIEPQDEMMQGVDDDQEFTSVLLEGEDVDGPAPEKLATPEDSPLDESEEAVDDASLPGSDVASALRAKGFQGNDPGLTDTHSSLSYFSIMDVIKDAWRETKGSKASIWAGSCVMYLVMFIIGAAGTFLMPTLGFDLTTMIGMVTNVVVQVLLTVVSIIFTAGLLYMGVRKVAGDPISWKMAFDGFSFTGQIILATVLQTILVGLGLLLLVLPGIYLAIGYGLTLPLILDRKMSAWEAMETSRKAIHKVWWRVTGTFFLMVCIYTISAIPLGIGLIWTVPMFIVLGGVVYHRLFGAE